MVGGSQGAGAESFLGEKHRAGVLDVCHRVSRHGLCSVPIRPKTLQPWDWLAEWAGMSVCIGAVWGLLDWHDKEKHYHESNQDGEKH